MNAVLPSCPQCASPQRVVKLSRLYMECLAYQREKQLDPDGALVQVFPLEGESQPDSRQISALLKHIAPPSGKSRTTRPINPDMAMAATALVTAFFLYRIFQSQNNVFLPALALALLLFAGYFLLRRGVMQRFQGQVESIHSEVKGVEQAVARWMNLYYCAADGTVFDPARRDGVPVEDIRYYLSR